jgi:DNA-directed RNA polymerase I, II, and III subunit RPABC4
MLHTRCDVHGHCHGCPTFWLPVVRSGRVECLNSESASLSAPPHGTRSEGRLQGRHILVRGCVTIHQSTQAWSQQSFSRTCWMREVRRVCADRSGDECGADCGADNTLRPGDVIQCRECGYRILYKKRTKRSTSSPGLTHHRATPPRVLSGNRLCWVVGASPVHSRCEFQSRVYN